MGVERNRNLDIVRACATLLVVLYHSWVLTNSTGFQIPIVKLIVSLGGELGVTCFFVLSGYGIYCSLWGAENNNSLSFASFMQKRCKRIIPSYYICLLITMFLGSGAIYLSRSNWANIITHVLFIHNLFPGYAGAINGVLWTIGVTVQFYIIAIPLYKGIKKWNFLFLSACIVFTVVCKTAVFRFVLPMLGGEHLGFFAGRQVLTSLDNFVVGMAVADLVVHRKKQLKRPWAYGGSLFGIAALLLICKIGAKCGIHTNNISGYVWHTLIAAAIGVFLYAVSYIECDSSRRLYRAFLWLSKCEYGIYLWHLVIIRNLIENASFVSSLMNRGYYKVLYIIFICVSVFMGWLMSKMTDSIRFDSIFRKKIGEGRGFPITEGSSKNR